MRNKKQLALLSLLHKIVDVFSGFFLNIYLFKITDGNFNFILFYAITGSVVSIFLYYFILPNLSSKNAKFIFRSGYICEVLSILLLLIARENIINFIWLFILLSRYSASAYYSVHEITLIGSIGKHSVSSYQAGVSILSSIIGLIAPVFLGFLITDFSYSVAMVVILIVALVSSFIASKMNFTVIDRDFHLFKYWRKVAKNKTMKKAYLAFYLRRLSGPDGMLQYLIPILLFLSLGTEFSAGSYDSLFSVVYIILLEIVRIFNKKGLAKRFYVPLALLCLCSALVMVANFNTITILLFYFTINTGAHLIQTESASMMYAIGKKEGMSRHTKEHKYTWDLCLSLGNITGVLIAYIIYNHFYTQNAFAVIITIFMAIQVVYAYFLQKIEIKLKNK